MGFKVRELPVVRTERRARYLSTFYLDWPCTENEAGKHRRCINKILLQGGTA